jgi:CheY-like chemotaxis protein
MRTRTFFTVIPIAEVPVYGSLQTPDGHCPAILVVDDERIIADTLSQIFNRSGYAAVPAYSAAMALEMAANVPPDLLITDVAMPGMSGVELAITIKTLYPGCKIILFSGQASTVDLLASARAAGHAFQTLSKPLHPAVMLNRVSELLPMRGLAV